MRDIDEGINPALAVFQQLPAIIPQLPSLTQDFILDQIQTCLGAALYLSEKDDKWQAPWQSVPYYWDEWSGDVAPGAAGDGLVFNYTYTLPQFLRAIYILLTTIGSLAPTTLGQYQSPLRGCLNRLSTVHETIVHSGIVGSRIPETHEVGHVVRDSNVISINPAYWESNWYGTDYLMWPYGAIEKYSGAILMKSYFENFYKINMEALDDATAHNFIALLQLRITQEKKLLYKQLGLPVIRQVMEHLRSLLGQPVHEPRYEDWTIRETFEIMGVAKPGSLRSLLSVIKQTPPFGNTFEFPDDGHDVFGVNVPVPGRPMPAGIRGLLFT